MPRDMSSEDEPAVELDVLNEQGEEQEPTPVVLIEGWAAGTPISVWDGIDELINRDRPLSAAKRRLFVIKCGSFSSIWDRAVEIFYALKGGRCDYGQEHSEKHGHARLGKVHEEGLYPLWSAEYPLHFIGHSFGGVTIFHLQQLLGKHLPGSPSWIKSVTTISSPHRGTPLGQALGQMDGPQAGQRPWSPSHLMAFGIHIARTLQVVGTEIYDMGGMHWLADDSHTTKYSMIDAVCDYLSGRAEGFSADSAGHDMLMRTAEQHNLNTKLCNDTYYRSYTAATSRPNYFPPLAYAWHLIHTFPHKDGAEAEGGADTDDRTVDEEWLENDALVPRASQNHPKRCHETRCLHLPQGLDPADEPPPIRGVWHVKHYPETTHFGLCDYLWKLGISDKTILFWTQFGEWLRVIDAQDEAEEEDESDGVREETKNKNIDETVRVVET